MYNLDTINSEIKRKEAINLENSENKDILSAINSILSNQFNNLEQKINKRFDKIEEKIKVIPKMQEQIKAIPEMQSNIEKMQNDIESMQSNIESMQNNIEGIQMDIKLIQKDIVDLQNKYEELYDETRNISRTVAKIEFEHGEKLAILFDAVTANNEKQELLKKRLDKCEKRIENNENQIYFLNSKIQNL